MLSLSGTKRGGAPIPTGSPSAPYGEREHKTPERKVPCVAHEERVSIALGAASCSTWLCATELISICRRMYVRMYACWKVAFIY